MKRRGFIFSASALLLSGCGFELRRLDSIPFSAIYIDAPDENSLASNDWVFTRERVVAKKIRDALIAGGKTRVPDSPAQAEATLKISQESRSKSILTLSGAGRVKEYRLNFKVVYSVTGKAGQEIVGTNSIELSRDFTYDDSQLLAKSQEEKLLYRDMEDDAARQILRHLHGLKLSST